MASEGETTHGVGDVFQFSFTKSKGVQDGAKIGSVPESDTKSSSETQVQIQQEEKKEKDVKDTDDKDNVPLKEPFDALKVSIHLASKEPEQCQCQHCKNATASTDQVGVHQNVRDQLMDAFWPHARFSSHHRNTSRWSANDFCTFLELSRKWDVPGGAQYWLHGCNLPVILAKKAQKQKHKKNANNDTNAKLYEMQGVFPGNLAVLKTTRPSKSVSQKRIDKKIKQLEKNQKNFFAAHVQMHGKLLGRLTMAMHPKLRKNCLICFNRAFEHYAELYHMDIQAIRAHYLDDGLFPENAEKHREILDVLGQALCALESWKTEKELNQEIKEYEKNQENGKQHVRQEIDNLQTLWTFLDGRRLVCEGDSTVKNEPCQPVNSSLWTRLQLQLDQTFLFDVEATDPTVLDNLMNSRSRATTTYLKAMSRFTKDLESTLHVLQVSSDNILIADGDFSSDNIMPKITGELSISMAQDMHSQKRILYLASNGTLSRIEIESKSISLDEAIENGCFFSIAKENQDENNSVENEESSSPSSSSSSSSSSSVTTDSESIMMQTVPSSNCIDKISCNPLIVSMSCSRGGRWVALLSASTGHVEVYEACQRDNSAATCRLEKRARTRVPMLASTCISFDQSIEDYAAGGSGVDDDDDDAETMPMLWVGTRFGLALCFELGNQRFPLLQSPESCNLLVLVCRRVVWTGAPLPITQIDAFGRRIVMLNEFGVVVHEIMHPVNEIRPFHEFRVNDPNGDIGNTNTKWKATPHDLRFAPHLVSFSLQDQHGFALHRNGVLLPINLGNPDGDLVAAPLQFMQRAASKEEEEEEEEKGGNKSKSAFGTLPYSNPLEPGGKAIKRPLIAFSDAHDAFYGVHPHALRAFGLQLGAGGRKVGALRAKKTKNTNNKA